MCLTVSVYDDDEDLASFIFVELPETILQSGALVDEMDDEIVTL